MEKKSKKGIPYKSMTEKAICRIYFCLTKKENEKLEEFVNLSGLSKSSFIRKKLKLE
jgi:hypothetical protein